MIAKEKNIHFTYLGTGCIFSYTEEHSKEEKNGFTIYFLSRLRTRRSYRIIIIIKSFKINILFIQNIF
jgi:hypothetical protein